MISMNSNSKYFHEVANGRHWKKIIHSLQQDEGTIEGHEQLKSYITNYYKNLFGAIEEGNFSMDETCGSKSAPYEATHKLGFKLLSL